MPPRNAVRIGATTFLFNRLFSRSFQRAAARNSPTHHQPTLPQKIRIFKTPSAAAKPPRPNFFPPYTYAYPKKRRRQADGGDGRTLFPSLFPCLHRRVPLLDSNGTCSVSGKKAAWKGERAGGETQLLFSPQRWIRIRKRKRKEALLPSLPPVGIPRRQAGGRSGGKRERKKRF